MKTRKECYDYIKSNQRVKEKIFNSTGCRYQCLPTGLLLEYINEDNSFINRIKRLFHK